MSQDPPGDQPASPEGEPEQPPGWEGPTPVVFGEVVAPTLTHEGEPEVLSAEERRRRTTGLAVLFGIIYFVQGVGEPTEGLVSQPVRKMLRDWDMSTEEITAFMGLLGLPWVIKPLYGLLTDFVPIFGYRRKSYLVLTSLVTLIGLVCAAVLPIPHGATQLLFWLLLLPSISIAFADVVADGLMVEKGQPLGATGRLQSVQWGCVYAAGLMTGVLGGYLSEHDIPQVGFLICGLLSLLTLVATLVFVKEERGGSVDLAGLKQGLWALWSAARSRVVLSVGAFLFLLNFNPFNSTVQYVHMTEHLGMSEQFVGLSYSVASGAAIMAAVVYGLFSERMSTRFLLHGSILFTIISTLLYMGLKSEFSAIGVSVGSGFVFMLATLVQLDLAARFVPTATAATVFALLMSLCNLSATGSTILGGGWYDTWSLRYGPETAFDQLVMVGACFTAGCWVLIPFLPKEESLTEIERRSSMGLVEDTQ
jgi:MFS family permease